MKFPLAIVKYQICYNIMLSLICKFLASLVEGALECGSQSIRFLELKVIEEIFLPGSI